MQVSLFHFFFWACNRLKTFTELVTEYAIQLLHFNLEISKTKTLDSNFTAV